MFNLVLIYSVILLMGKTMMRYPLEHHSLPIFDLILKNKRETSTHNKIHKNDSSALQHSNVKHFNFLMH